TGSAAVASEAAGARRIAAIGAGRAAVSSLGAVEQIDRPGLLDAGAAGTGRITAAQVQGTAIALETTRLRRIAADGYRGTAALFGFGCRRGVAGHEQGQCQHGNREQSTHGETSIVKIRHDWRNIMPRTQKQRGGRLASRKRHGSLRALAAPHAMEDVEGR